MRDVRVPFRQAVAPAEMTAWQLKSGDAAIELPDHHENWDPTVDLEVSRKITVDGARLRDECALVDDVRLRLLGGWHSENARTKHFPWRYDLRLPNRFEGTIEFRIPGAEVATSIDLIVGAVLVAKERRQPLVAASVPGSWLWKDVQELRLEQTHGRFPMEWTDFGRSGLPAEAPWYLDWPSQDWDAPLLGALRLRLNATNPAMRNVMELPETDGKRQIAIRSAILDVAKQLVIAALGSDDFVENHASCPEGSVGFSIRLLIAMAFQGESMATLRTRLRDHAGNFHMQLQAAVVPFRELGE
jgi:hypothetical protein